MRIRAVEIRNYRSIACSGLDRCGDLNILIGKNNAGKSNVLAAIELVMSHLKRGSLAVPWHDPRREDEFNNRNIEDTIRIGVEFELSSETNESLRNALALEAPNLERSIQQISEHTVLSFVLAAAHQERGFYSFIEQIAVGDLQSRGADLSAAGIKLLSVPKSAATELASAYHTAELFRGDRSYLEHLMSDRERMRYYFREEERPLRADYLFRLAGAPRDALRPRVQAIIESAESQEAFITGVSRLLRSIEEDLTNVEAKELENPMAAFAGEVRRVPAYVHWLIERYGKIEVLPLKERREPIGPKEATLLLQFKVRRGGEERFEAIQSTVGSILGVKFNAWEAEISDSKSRTAEIDIDNFLLEVNGAGVREALRLILDLELNNASLALIEEPEVHLHPGLASTVAGYLRQKSRTVQMFVATQSTEFVDSVTFQNAYLISRDLSNQTVCQRMSAEEAVLRIPTELGLRLSSVFMFDRLVFVEGQIDEMVLRTMAGTLGLDLTKSNVGFVQMGGVRNFAHFAAEGTLELLSRRKIRMWFVTDRDERDDREVQKMVERLGERAKLIVFKRRELENYLLDDSSAISVLIGEKLDGRGGDRERPTEAEVQQAVNEEAGNLLDELVRLRLEKMFLAPMFLHVRGAEGGIEDRLDAAIKEAEGRKAKLVGAESELRADLSKTDKVQFKALVPGTLLLERVFKRFAVSFMKEKGDSERLAQFVRREQIPEELRTLLTDICGEN